MRAFNQIYEFNMSRRDEIKFTYLGKITTPSPCGRMDQACAYGNQPIAIIFDGDVTEVIELKVPKDLFFVIVDLATHKNTQVFLSKLN
ncbi:hypothetical protein [Trichormus azollae]|uniref:hypothetical protein n=1 Tax=Trichormus azollae TaxID=1164 RepID=UPI0022582BAE|nr:hypothetical protein [Trichormus azollae]